MISSTIIYSFVALGLIILIVYAGKYIMEYSSHSDTKMIIQWFILLIILNIFITTFILASYRVIKFKHGPTGPKGKRGADGKQGKDGSCVMCTPALMGLKSIPITNKIDRIDPMLPDDEKKLFTRNLR